MTTPNPSQFTGSVVDPVSGECTSRFLDIGLAVVSFTETIQLEQFPGKVLVWLLPGTTAGVEVDRHRRVNGHTVDQLAEVSAAQLAKHLILFQHRRCRANLGHLGSEMAMPHQHQSFGQGRRSGDQFPCPPAAQLTLPASHRLLKDLATLRGFSPLLLDLARC